MGLRRVLPANDNHPWWGAAPFGRRHIPIVIAAFMLGIAAVVGLGILLRSLT